MGEELRQFRRQLREELLARRSALLPAARAAAAAAVCDFLEALAPELPDGPLAFYWPIREEIDIRPFASREAARGRLLALPVIVAKKAPLQFRRWFPGVPMTSGIWDIPIPAPDEPLFPATVIVPLVGWDRAGFRLGYGGGYYDRTLAQLRPRPLVIGIGFAFARLADIQPQPHDQRLDLAVCEEGIERFTVTARSMGAEVVACASPPCLAHEIDPAFRDLG
ncbi:5-formyltetrahydrofolate cyclo-ligase [bacterium HR40]|nr:5-formyltetrahydrofolate cyclo-ligase [bacterium HR40]